MPNLLWPRSITIEDKALWPNLCGKAECANIMGDIPKECVWVFFGEGGEGRQKKNSPWYILGRGGKQQGDLGS